MWTSCFSCGFSREEGDRDAPASLMDGNEEPPPFDPKALEPLAEEEEEDLAEAGLARPAPRPRARQVLAAGALRLLSAAWLLARGEAYVLKRMQDLPGDAFVDPEKAAELLDKAHGIVVVSCGWLSKRHPDPTGFHMHTVQKYLKKHLGSTDYDDVGVFWDFASLPQDSPDGTKKTQQEAEVLTKGLGALGLLYGGQKTLVIQLTAMPADLRLQGGTRANLTPYNTRGWCFFEARVASLLKDSELLLDLGLCAETLEREDAGWTAVQKAAAGARLPPLTPQDMAKELRQRRFTNSADVQLVARLYAEFFEEAAAGAARLGLTNFAGGGGWGDAEVAQLSRALPAFTACKTLTLCHHKTVGEQGLAHLRAAVVPLPALQTLWLPGHLQHTREGRALSSEWQAAGKREGPGGLRWL